MKIDTTRPGVEVFQLAVPKNVDIDCKEVQSFLILHSLQPSTSNHN